MPNCLSISRQKGSDGLLIGAEIGLSGYRMRTKGERYLIVEREFEFRYVYDGVLGDNPPLAMEMQLGGPFLGEYPSSRLLAGGTEAVEQFGGGLHLLVYWRLLMFWLTIGSNGIVCYGRIGI